MEQATHKNILNNLSFISNGTHVFNPGALLLNERLPQFLDRCSEQYDIIIVDAPPVLLVSDVPVAGQNLGAIFMVVRDGVSTETELSTAVKRLNQARVEVKGMLFNGQMLCITGRYAYENGYGYKYDSINLGVKQGVDRA